MRVHPTNKDLWPQPLWVVLHVDQDDLGNYLLSQTQEAVKCWFKLQKPAWGCHISITRGKTLTDPDMIYDFDGKVVEFFYSTNIYQYHGHFCTNVICEKASEIRKNLGLDEEYLIRLHMTIGVAVQPCTHIQLLQTSEDVSAIIKPSMGDRTSF